MTAPIRHEVASQRRHFRVNAPILIHIYDRFYSTVNWSVVDFKVSDYAGNAKPDDVINVTVSIPYQGFDINFTTKARVLKVDKEERTLVAEFLQINEREREVLENFVAGLLRGEMESIDNVIRRLDVPVTPVSLKADVPVSPEELAVLEKKRQIGSMLYLGAGLVFSLVLAVLLYTNFFQVKVKTAVLSAPTDIIISPATGSVKEFLLDERAHAEKGMGLISFSDPELEQNIERAALRLEEIVGQVSTNGTINGNAKNINSDEVRAAKAAVASLKSNLEVKQKQVRRQKELMAEGLTNKIALDKAQSEYYDVQGEYNLALQRLGQLTQQSSTKMSLLSAAEGEYKMLKEQRDRLHMKAPANGTLLKYLARPGGSIRYGDPVAIFQHDEPRYVEAYITRDEALSVAAGDSAKVHFPSHGITENYKVVDVDYASQLVSRREGRYVLDQAGLMRDVLVKLELSAENPHEALKTIQPGTSAEVIFSKPIFGR